MLGINNSSPKIHPAAPSGIPHILSRISFHSLLSRSSWESRRTLQEEIQREKKIKSQTEPK